MTPEQHEAEIDRLQAEMLKEPDVRKFGDQFLMAVLARNSERTPEQVAELEQTLGLR